ncbi:MAG: pirin family protein [Thermomonas sp.]|uniref:pirin family protein n=1 Tax=Thermomonas sp. TaxID=1971895 RepID=UPI001ED38619|nr:pirin family protein [Thermomonas sp.]MBV2208732.1 pirin family protein [Thermomonas sp.]
MIVERPAAERGDVALDWLHSHHTFSFGHYYDPAWMGFGVLRVINDDTVAPGGGFAPHRHANMEIISVVLEGTLAHQDSTGNAGVIRAGDVQWMSAGHGIEHSEYNGSNTEPVHFLQIWIQPDRLNYAPAYDQKHFSPDARRGRWAVLASPEGEGGSIAIRQQVKLSAARLVEGASVQVALDPTRRYWLHVATGAVQYAGRVLHAGDALGFVEETGVLTLQGVAEGDVLLFDLPA